LAAKIAQIEIERRAEKDDIVKGSQTIGGRESYISNRGSEIAIKEAIRGIEND
jgi:hypothetical protein